MYSLLLIAIFSTLCVVYSFCNVIDGLIKNIVFYKCCWAQSKKHAAMQTQSHNSLNDVNKLKFPVPPSVRTKDKAILWNDQETQTRN